MVHRHLDHLRRVQSTAVRQLLDLGLAREAVGDDKCVLWRCAHSRQELSLADGDRDVVVVTLESERSRHAAATRVEQLDLEPEPLEQ